MTKINMPTLFLKGMLTAGLMAFGILCFMYGLSSGQVETPKQQIINGEQKDLERLYKELKNERPEENIEIHYIQQTIIKESREKDEYLTHLVSELRKALQKGKKAGMVRRVEGSLVEIDKGAVHKVHERDVYIVHDSSGRYKSKLEVEAIADAISIGTSYEQKVIIEPGDTIKFRGQRKLLDLGLIYGFNKTERGERFWGLGMIWKYNLRSGWGFDFIGAYMKGLRSTSSEWESSKELVSIPILFGARKYFYYPFWISPFVGLGGSYMKIDYQYTAWDNNYILTGDDNISTIKIVPYFLVGTQLSGEQFHVNLEARYLYGPKLNAEPEPFKVRPIIYYTSISFAW